MEHKSACDHFTQHAWRPDQCSTCQKGKSEHSSSTASRSWRRKSEPNPNNAITGVRISALASKFQSQEVPNKSMPDTESERAKTLERKPKQFNKCLSSELLDSSPLSSSSSSLLTSTSSSISTSAISNSHHSSDHIVNIRHIRTEGLKYRSQATVSSRPTAASNSHTSVVANTNSDKNNATHTSTTKTILISSSLTNSNSASSKTSTITSSSARVSSQLSTTSLQHQVTKLNASQQPGNNIRKHPVLQSSLKSTTLSSSSSSSTSTSILKNNHLYTGKEGVSSKDKVPHLKGKVSHLKEKSQFKEKRRVSIPDLEPDVIGHDGGLDNLYPEEECCNEDDNGQLYLSLTDEEKQFALLALGNTVWNSDTRNLQVESEIAKRECREFEDVNVDQLLSKDRFKTLVDCDATKKKQESGTYPQINNSKLSKISLKNINFNSEVRTNVSKGSKMTINSVYEVDDLSNQSNNSDCVKSTSVSFSVNSSSTNSEMPEGNVEISNKTGLDCKIQPHIKNCAIDLKERNVDLGLQNSCEVKSHLTNVDKNYKDDLNNQNIVVLDSTLEEELRTVDLLNDVLKGYGDLNESSTDDFETKNVRKETLKGKKSLEFEARMASVAATLDLAKQQQRGKRQAPRPPVSPPPEPDVTEAISPKKVSNQPDPVFKMVTIGKSIITLPPQQDLLPQDAKPAIVSYGLDDFGSLPEASENNKTNGDGKSKKGITSFFRNILRRGKDSGDSFESNNPDVQLNFKVEKEIAASNCGHIEMTNEDSTLTLADMKLGATLVSKTKASVIPLSSQECSNSDCTTNGGDSVFMSDSETVRAASSGVAITEAPVNASPPVIRKSSMGLSSPKLTLRKTTAVGKSSPPISRHIIKPQEHESLQQQDASALVAKPYPAPKPGVPPLVRPFLSEQPLLEATTGKEKNSATDCKESTSVPNVVHRRPKSPKRTAPPIPPNRSSAGTVKTESQNTDLAKELEWRLKKAAVEQSGDGTLSRTELRESTRRSLPTPPSPPLERKEKHSAAVQSGSPPVSPINEIPNSLPSSPCASRIASFEFVPTEWSGGSTSTIDDELPKFSEKIELPTVATQSRIGFLGKLAGNRKSRAPQPPVKRTKSITQSSTLPRGEKKSKKINVADISGPVIVAEVTNGKVMGNRRNTISLGEDPTFAGMSVSCLHLGPASSSSSIEKGGFDEFDFPVLSPLGSLENLYEAILPKPEGIISNIYDPPTSPKVFCPNVLSDGYLEPVPPLSSLAAVTTSASTSSPSTSLSIALSTTINLSSTSLITSSTTNTMVVKSLLKSQTSSSRNERIIQKNNTNDSVSAHNIQTQLSTSSSESNSTESSGSSNPESNQTSFRAVLDSQTSNKSEHSDGSISSKLGPHFIEPEITEQRRILLASQPIYEEIPNGENDDYGDDIFREKSERERSSKCSVNFEDNVSMKKNIIPSTGVVEVTKSQVTHSWLQLQQSHFVTPPSSTSSSSSLPSSSILSTGVVQSSPSRGMPKQNMQSISASQMSSLMTTSLTSSMLPPPPPPPDPLLAPNSSISCSISRETVSSESDTQSNCSNETQSNCSNETQSNCSTFSRPRPAPRQKPRKRVEAGISDQYVSMNRPNTQVSLSEDKLRDVFTKLTSITFHALQDIYAQCEKILSVDRLNIPGSKMLKWADFDIYGQPLHSSGRCVVYNAKLRASECPCQIMILHSRPATILSTSSHPSLLRPSAVFADTIPFSFLTQDFIKTSQLLQNSVYDSNLARCFLAVGAFDIVESLDTHLVLLRETLAQDMSLYLNIVQTAALQLLSAMSHCLDQGFSVTETDYNDIFLITRSDLHGKVVAFLPRQRSPEVPQGEAMCNFLDRFLAENIPDHDDIVEEEDADSMDEFDEMDKIISSPKKVLMKLRSMLKSKKVECLGQVRTAVEYMLWGPVYSELLLSPSGEAKAKPGETGWEQELYVWLEKERLTTVSRLARSLPGLGAGLTLEDFYTLKFLLKTSAGCLAESYRQLSI